MSDRNFFRTISKINIFIKFEMFEELTPGKMIFSNAKFVAIFQNECNYKIHNVQNCMMHRLRNAHVAF